MERVVRHQHSKSALSRSAHILAGQLDKVWTLYAP